jgi:Zn-dependent protease with chaperone function
MRHLSKRKSFNWFLGGLVLLLCGWIHLGWSPTSPAQELNDSEFGQDTKNAATLVFDFDRQGQASAFLSIYYSRNRSPSPQDWTGITQSLNELMPGCSFESRGAGDSRDYGFFKGNCDAAFSHQGHQRWLISKFLDLMPLLQQLTAVAPIQLDLRLSMPDLGIARTVPALTRTGALPFPAGGLDQPVRYSQSFQSNQPVLPIAIEFGYRPRDILLRGLSIPAVILLPIALLWVLRDRALRSRATDPAPIWFGYLRSLNFLVIGTWTIWSGVHIAVGLGDVLTFMLGKGIAIDLMREIVFFTPPCLSTILCFALSHPVYVKLGQSDLTRADLIQQAFWSQLNVVMPLILLLTAIKAFFDSNLAIGLVYVVASQTSRLILAPIALKASGLTTQSITTGDLRDRIFGLAQLAGVKLQQVYVIPIGRGKMANAFAVEGGCVWLTDYLLKNMSREEVDAVMAHELAHFQLGHHQSRQLVTIVTLLLFGFLLVPFIMLFSIWLPSLPWLITPLCIITVLLTSTFYSRKHEHQADIQAGVLTQNPAAMITALVKLSRLSRMPLQLSVVNPSHLRS